MCKRLGLACMYVINQYRTTKNLRELYFLLWEYINVMGKVVWKKTVKEWMSEILTGLKSELLCHWFSES